MAFDHVSAGPPTGGVAGSPQSPTLAVDVTDYSLYVCAGAGWQAVSGGGGGGVVNNITMRDSATGTVYILQITNGVLTQTPQ